MESIVLFVNETRRRAPPPKSWLCRNYTEYHHTQTLPL